MKTNAKEIISFKMHLTPHMYKIVTMKTNAKEIINLKCF